MFRSRRRGSCAAAADPAGMLQKWVLCSESFILGNSGLSDVEMKDVNICHVDSDITVEQLRERNLIFLPSV